MLYFVRLFKTLSWSNILENNFGLQFACSLKMACASSGKDIDDLMAFVSKLHEQTLNTIQSSSTALHNKLDKLVRQIDQVVETQKKMAKSIQTLSKAVDKSSPSPQASSSSSSNTSAAEVTYQELDFRGLKPSHCQSGKSVTKIEAL
jgi:methyl-accepting chemotaxis protein